MPRGSHTVYALTCKECGKRNYTLRWNRAKAAAAGKPSKPEGSIVNKYCGCGEAGRKDHKVKEEKGKSN